jgi:hypothetical protein
MTSLTRTTLAQIKMQSKMLGFVVAKPGIQFWAQELDGHGLQKLILHMDVRNRTHLFAL